MVQDVTAAFVKWTSQEKSDFAEMQIDFASVSCPEAMVVKTEEVKW
jgi:hypothetical protein